MFVFFYKNNVYKHTEPVFGENGSLRMCITTKILIKFREIKYN